MFAYKDCAVSEENEISIKNKEFYSETLVTHKSSGLAKVIKQKKQL